MKDSTLKEIKEWIVSIVIAALIAFLIKGFVIDTMLVDGTSMLPNLHNRDRIIFEKVSLYSHNIKRGQIIILNPPEKPKSIYYVKRIIGLPGEKVKIKGGFVYIDGKKLTEPYLASGTYTGDDMTLTVPENSVFVLGDNREVSEDSRVIGPIPIENIKGHAVLRIYPFDKITKFN